MKTPTAPLEPQIRTVTVNEGTVAHLIASATLTFDGQDDGDNPYAVRFSDLGLPGYWERYQDRMGFAVFLLQRLDIPFTR